MSPYLGEIIAIRGISGFRREIDEVCALVGYYASSIGNSLPTFRDGPLGPIFRGLIANDLKLIDCVSKSSQNWCNYEYSFDRRMPRGGV